jgi:hypothetical protein
MRLQKINRLLISLAGIAALFIIVTPKIVSAEPITFYEFRPDTAECNDGDTTLITPFVRNGKSYYCMKEPRTDGSGSYVLKGSGECPTPGQPTYDVGPSFGGIVCITAFPGGVKWGTSVATATSSDPIGGSADLPKYVANDCNAEGGVLNSGNCGIVKYLLIFINGLSAIVGVVIVLVIIVGGIQYAASADDPSRVSAAKKRILNAILGLVTFIFMYAFLQYIVPGGVF